MLLAAAFSGSLPELLSRYGLSLAWTPAAIPASFWGPPEAGLRGAKLYASNATPLHSVLHEAAHFICMTPQRRLALDTDAGGDDAEESAVCYLQLRLAEQLESGLADRLMADMDGWGYSFRLGSTHAWFVGDSDHARSALRRWGLLDERDQPTYQVRAASPSLHHCAKAAPR